METFKISDRIQPNEEFKKIIKSEKILIPKHTEDIKLIQEYIDRCTYWDTDINLITIEDFKKQTKQEQLHYIIRLHLLALIDEFIIFTFANHLYADLAEEFFKEQIETFSYSRIADYFIVKKSGKNLIKVTSTRSVNCLLYVYQSIFFDKFYVFIPSHLLEELKKIKVKKCVFVETDMLLVDLGFKYFTELVKAQLNSLEN